MSSPPGLTHGLTDAEWLSFSGYVGPRGGGIARDRTGVRDLIGAWSRSPATVLSARPAGACRPTGISERTAVTSMTDQALEVTGGVDTHGETHHAAVIDRIGRHLADREFPATGTGYRQRRLGSRVRVRHAYERRLGTGSACAEPSAASGPPGRREAPEGPEPAGYERQRRRMSATRVRSPGCCSPRAAVLRSCGPAPGTWPRRGPGSGMSRRG